MDKPQTAKLPPHRRLWQALNKKHLCILALILVLCCGLFLWAGYTFLPGAANLSRRQIVNDDYSTLTAPLTAGGEIRQDIHVQGRLYGVQLNVATHNRVVRGTLHLQLVDAAGNLAATCDTDMTALYDNTFHRFLFSHMVDAGDGADYTLVFTTSPATAQDVVSFHRSNGPAADFVPEGETEAPYPLAGFTLSQNGDAVDGVLALQYTVRYAGSFIYGVYSFFAALLTVFLLALYALVFLLKAPLHRIFIVCVLVLGFVFCFLIPPRTAPDEYVHISNAYHYSNVFLGTDEQDGGADGGGYLYIRPGDEMKLDNYDIAATDIFAYQDMAEGLFAKAPDGEMGKIEARTVAGTFPPMYWPQAVGVILARLLGLGQVGLLFLGRFCNLVFYTLVASRAIKRMPLAKPALFCAALLPMCLQLAASFSYDTYVIALSFYYIALCLDYAIARKQMGAPQLVLLGAVALLLAPAKAVYLLLLPLLFIIPPGHFSSKKACMAARGAILGLAVLCWAAFTLGAVNIAGASPAGIVPEAVAEADPGGAARTADGHLLAAPDDAASTDVLPNGDAAEHFTPGYTLRHIPAALKVLARSFWEQGPLWLQGLIGGRLGEIIAIKLEVNWLFVIGLLGVLVASALPMGEGENLILSRRRRLGALGIFVCTAALFLAASLTWTPVNYTTLFGMQGRYFLPALPLLLLAVRGHSLRFAKPVWRQLAYAAAVLCVLVQLNAFLLVIAR